jgi:putative transcriptional regulator
MRERSKTRHAGSSTKHGGHPTPMLTARHFDVPGEPETMSPVQIARLRRDVLGVSQRIFAGMMNVAAQTVHAWEQGVRRPCGSALRLLCLAQQDPGAFRSLVERRRREHHLTEQRDR